MNRTPIDVTIVRWTARLLSLALVVLWGAFFLEHLSWFAGGWASHPPPRVFAFQALHLLLLVSYLVGLRFERAGSAMIVASALTFFGMAGGPDFAIFAGGSSLPALLYLYCLARERVRRVATP